MPAGEGKPQNPETGEPFVVTGGQRGAVQDSRGGVRGSVQRGHAPMLRRVSDAAHEAYASICRRFAPNARPAGHSAANARLAGRSATRLAGDVPCILGAASPAGSEEVWGQ